MSTRDPIKDLLDGLDSKARHGLYEDLDEWATRMDMPDDKVARYILSFSVALFVKLGAPDLTLLRFVTRIIEMAHKEIDAREGR